VVCGVWCMLRVVLCVVCDMYGVCACYGMMYVMDGLLCEYCGVRCVVCSMLCVVGCVVWDG